MKETANQESWCLPENVVEVHTKPALGYIMARWPEIGAVAWQGYQEQGRGTVLLDDEGSISFRLGSPCPCHQHAADSYDPEQQVVVALHHGETIDSVHVVAGWPAPPDAYRITPGERFRLTAH